MVKKPFFESVLVRPEMAKKMLDTLIKNRVINWKRVHLYAEEMKAGRWRLNGEPIKMNDKKQVLDGQHRLLAIMEAGVSVWLTIASDIETDAFATMDSGYTRKASQVYRMQNIKNATIVCGIVARKDETEKTGFYYSGGHSRDKLGTNEGLLMKFYEDVEGYGEAASIAQHCHQKLHMFPPTFLGSIFYYLRHTGKYEYIECEDFFKTLHTLGDNKVQQAAVLRDLVLKKQVNNAAKLKPEYSWCLIAKAWNKYVKGEPIKCLNYAPEVEGQIRFILKPNLQYPYYPQTIKLNI